MGLALLAACRPAPPGDLDLWRAENALAQGRQDWARIHFQRDLDRHPERLSSLRALGFAWLSGYQQSLSTGIEVLDRYLASRPAGSPADPEVAIALARAELALGHGDAAAARLDGAGDGLEAELLRAEVLLDREPASAVAAAERAVALAPGDFRAALRLAEARDRTGDTVKARAEARRAAELNPLSYPAFYLLARLERRLGDEAAARRAFDLHALTTRLQSAGTLAPAPPAERLALLRELAASWPAAQSALPTLRLQAELAFATANLGLAQASLEAVARHPEADAGELMSLAALAHQAGRTSAARLAIDAALAREPDHLGALLSRAQLAIESGDLAAASDLLSRLAEGHPHLARRAWLESRLCQAQGQEEAATLALRQALDLAPWEAAWRLELADRLLALGHGSEAAELVAAAPEPTPELGRWRAKALAAQP